MSPHQIDVEIWNDKKYENLIKFRHAIEEAHSLKNKCRIIDKLLPDVEFINYQIPSNRYTRKKPYIIGYTALHFAASDPEIFEMLIQRGADFTLKSDSDLTALHLAIYGDEACRYVLSERRWNFLKDVLRFSYVKSVLQGHIDRNNRINPCSSNGFSHFHLACISDNAKAVEFFLSEDDSNLVNEPIGKNSEVFRGYTPLHLATRHSALETVKVLLNYGADTQLKDIKGMTPLHVVIEQSMAVIDLMNTVFKKNFQERIKVDKEIIGLVFDKSKIRNGDSYDTDNIGLTSLHVACIKQEYMTVEALIKQYPDLLDKSINYSSQVWPGYTPLHFAAHFSLDILILLVKSGGNLLTADAKGLTPLDLCLQRYKTDLCSIIACQPNLEQVSFSDGQTKLSDFISSTKELDTLNSFLKLIDVNLPISSDSPLWPGCTPLHLLVLLTGSNSSVFDMYVDLCIVEPHVNGEYNSNRKKWLEKLQLCLDLGADVTLKNAAQLTPLHLACYLQKEEIIEKLIKHHVTISNPVTEHGLSHLHLACIMCDKNLIEKLLHDGADVNIRMQDEKGRLVIRDRELISIGSTPLHIAVAASDRSDDSEMVKILLNSDANLYVQNEINLTPIHLLFAITQSYQLKEIGEVLLSREDLEECATDFGLSHLHSAALLNNAKAVDKLLDLGANIESTIKCNDESEGFSFLKRFNGCTPLHIAIKKRCKEALRALVQRGADAFAKKTDGSIPLFDLLKNVSKESNDIIEELLKNDTIRRRLEMEFGIGMLHIACAMCNLQVVNELLENGADVNAKINDDSPIGPGSTPLHILIKNMTYSFHGDHDLLLHLLLDCGANIMLEDANQDTPLHKCTDSLKFLYMERLLGSRSNSYKNSINLLGLSHFHAAILTQNASIVEKFLQNNPNICNSIGCSIQVTVPGILRYNTGKGIDGCSPLHLSLIQGNPDETVIDLLLDHNVNVQAEDGLGNTPLHLVVSHDSFDERFFHKLINAGGNVNAENYLGVTPFERLLTTNYVTAELVELFLNHGSFLNGYNPISEEGYIGMALKAERNKSIDEKVVFKYILKALGENCATDNIESTPIHNVVSIKQSSISAEDYCKAIAWLTDKGFDIDCRDNKGRTALHVAVEFCNENGILGLLNNGCDVNIVDSTDLPAFFYALTKSTRPIINVFLVHLCKLYAFELFISEINDMCLDRLLEEVPSFNFDAKMNQYYEESGSLDEEFIDLSDNKFPLFAFLSDYDVVVNYPNMFLKTQDAINKYFENNKNHLHTEFPDYAGLLLLQYRKALKRIDLIDPAASSLERITEIMWPYLCSRAILQFLTNEDLKNLIASTSI